VSATNVSGDANYSNEFSINVAAVPGVVSFDGPDISIPSLTRGQAMTSVNVSGRFSDSQGETRTFSKVGTWPDGVTLTSAGVIQGTPTQHGTFASLKVRATNQSLDTEDSNAFTITVARPPGVVSFSGTIAAQS